MFPADALSRALVLETGDDSLQEEVETLSVERLREYREAQEQDSVCCQLRQYCMTEWLRKKFISPENCSIL